MSNPLTNFVIGIVSAVYTPVSASAINLTGLLMVEFQDRTQQNGEGYDNSIGWDVLWNGAMNGSTTLNFRDPKHTQNFTAPILAGTVTGQGVLVVTGQNRQSGGKNQIHTFNPFLPKPVSGNIAGGNQSPESVSVGGIYGGACIITDAS